MRYRILFPVLLILFLISCDRPLPTLDGVDQTKWKNDKNGCDGSRSSMLTSLKEQQTKLQGLSEMQIINIFGRPDQNELYKRNQKFFFYWISGPNCAKDSVQVRLGIRFTAMGIAKEISFE